MTLGMSKKNEEKIRSMPGSKFGRLTVIKREPNYKSGATRWLCRCDCGKEIVTYGSFLRTGKTRSCGCLALEVRAKTPYIHGMVGSRLYEIWHGMKKRCDVPSSTHYERYGGRGITVCDEWEKSFECFFSWAMDNGYNDSLELDRIDNDSGYCPANCRWVTHKENCQNRSASKKKISS